MKNPIVRMVDLIVTEKDHEEWLLPFLYEVHSEPFKEPNLNRCAGGKNQGSSFAILSSSPLRDTVYSIFIINPPILKILLL